MYFTVTRNAISIPPWTNPINDIMGAQRATIETLVEAMGEEAGLSFAYQKYFGDKYSYFHLFPHKQQELVKNLEQLAAAASVTPTPEPPDGNPLLEAANLPYGPAPLTKNKTSAKIIQMPQRKII